MRVKNVISFILVSLMLILFNCDPHVPRKMLINDSKEVTINFGDNKIVITAVNWGGWILNYDLSVFYIYIHYYLNHDITIHKDVIHIEYNGKVTKCGLISNIDSKSKRVPFRNTDLESNIKRIDDQTIRDPNYKLSGNGHLSIHLSISDDIEVKKGDKIKITAPDFITYDGDTVSLGELTLEIGKFYR